MIPVFEPDIGEAEISAVVEALRAGEISGSFGENLPRFEEGFAAYCGVEHGVAVTSGTTALHLAVAALDLEPGSEILISASTNIATALAVIHNGHIPVAVDSEDITWNLDLDKIEQLITPRTKAIIPVHLYGHPVDMDRLMEIATAHDLAVIEDCAEAHGAEVRGRRVGSFGHMSCFSFYANKVITTGEGGMVVTDDAALAERLRLLRNLGFTQPRFVHRVAAFNFRMTGYQAAMGWAQLARIDSIIDAKRRVAATYNSCLEGLDGIRCPVELDWARNVYWMYAIVVRSDRGLDRDELAERLRAKGIDTRTFFCPMDRQPVLIERGVPGDTCPVAGRLWKDGLYLPSSTSLDVPTIQAITDEIRSSCESMVDARQG